MSPVTRTIAVAALSLVALVGCRQAPTPMVGLSADDQAAIRQAVDDALAMANADKPDMDAYTRGYYAADALVLAPNMPAVRGHEAIAELMKSFPISDLRVEIVELEGLGDMAWARGTYSMTLMPANAEPMSDTGKYVEIWKRQADGSWRVVRDIFNSDRPVESST